MIRLSFKNPDFISVLFELRDRFSTNFKRFFGILVNTFHVFMFICNKKTEIWNIFKILCFFDTKTLSFEKFHHKRSWSLCLQSVDASSWWIKHSLHAISQNGKIVTTSHPLLQGISRKNWIEFLERFFGHFSWCFEAIKVHSSLTLITYCKSQDYTPHASGPSINL